MCKRKCEVFGHLRSHNYHRPRESILKNVELVTMNPLSYAATTSVALRPCADEKLFQEKNNTIVRFGGLIGNKRNPLKYLQKKEEILNPEAPINYIHLKDCIGIINSIIEKNMWGKTFVGVSPYHPSKKEYYDRLCNEKNLNKLNFSRKETIVNKEINDENILKLLNYKFINPKF